MSNIELTIKITDNKIVPPDRLQMKNAFENLIDGRYKITIRRLYRHATHNQYKWLWGAIHKEFQKALISQGWDAENLDDVAEICKQLFSSKSIVNKHTGEIITIPESRSHFSTTDMMTYIEAIRDYAAENLNYFIEPPDPNWAENLEEKHTK
jgi:hypothetical protein